MAKFIVGCIAGSVFTMEAILTVFILGTVGGDDDEHKT